MQENERPFRKIALTSYFSGGVAAILGILLLLASKADMHTVFWKQGVEKILLGIGLIGAAFRWFQVGLQHEGAFTLKDVFDPEHNRSLYSLLQHKEDINRMFQAKAYSLHRAEKTRISNWQLLFYKLISSKGISRVFDYLPYPIGNFITRQSRPVVLFAGVLLLFLALAFLSYLDELPFNATLADLNILLMAVLLFLWRPARIKDVLYTEASRDLRRNTLAVVVIAFVAYLIYQRVSEGVHLGIFLTLVVVTAVLVWISFIAIRLIGREFATRPNISVRVSEGSLQMQSVHKQADVIFKQFENILANAKGWQDHVVLQHHNPLEYVKKEEHSKGTFGITRMYETPAKPEPLAFGEQTTQTLELSWKIGTALNVLGIFIFALGGLLTDYPLASLYCLLTGTAFFFLGNKLVYEIYMFFHSEARFESDLVFFNIDGSYGEYEQIIMGNQTKRKDTYTDFTPEIKVCTVISHVFVHPYLGKDQLKTLPRFIVSIEKNHDLYHYLSRTFEEHMERMRAELPPTGH